MRQTLLCMERSQLQMINAAGGHINGSKDANKLPLYFIFTLEKPNFTTSTVLRPIRKW